jgi:hAT family C-terminal dimerisation region
MATSSAASERSFSTNGFIHSKLRNSLKEENVQKLLFITSNALQLGKDLLTIDGQDSEDDTDDVDAGSFNSNSSSNLRFPIEDWD